MPAIEVNKDNFKDYKEKLEIKDITFDEVYETLDERPRKFFNDLIIKKVAVREAYLAAGYETTNDNSTSASACRLKKKLKPLISLFFRDEGLGPSVIRQRHMELLDSKDEKISIKAVELAYKLEGAFAPEKHALTDPNGEPLGVIVLPPREFNKE